MLRCGARKQASFAAISAEDLLLNAESPALSRQIEENEKNRSADGKNAFLFRLPL